MSAVPAVRPPDLHVVTPAAPPAEAPPAQAPSGALPSGALSSGAAAASARRRELGDFLRSRRERLSPEQCGLPTTGRRRTPGLRREEVATLAGVGVTWYTWLEQARAVTPSPQVVDAIARALLLDEHERTHLFILAGIGPWRPSATERTIDPAVKQLLRALEPFPAMVGNARYDILAYNVTYRHIISDLDRIPADERNTLWLMFNHPAWIAANPEVGQARSRLVGQFRGAMAEHMNEPAWRCLLRRLQTSSPDFARLWERHEVRRPETMLKTVISPGAGVLRLTLTHLWLDQGLGRRVSVYTPADDESHDRLARLTAEHGGGR